MNFQSVSNSEPEPTPPAKGPLLRYFEALNLIRERGGNWEDFAQARRDYFAAIGQDAPREEPQYQQQEFV